MTNDHQCFGCGELNPDGMGLRFESGDGVARAEYAVPDRLRGWKDVVHGGVVALMLDEAMCWAHRTAATSVVTGKLSVRFRLPLGVGERILIVGRVDRTRRNLVYASAHIDRVRDRARIAEATGLLMEVSLAGPSAPVDS